MRKGNGEPLDAKAVGLRIRTLLPTLTALEARVASGLISQGAIDEKTLLKWVAEETGVSKAMIVKIAKKLGFNGFRSFRAELAEYNRLPIAEIHEELGRSQTSRAIVEQAIGAAIDALEVSLPVISGDAVEQAAVHLCSARQRDFYGVGGSAQIARDAAFKFLRIGIRASVFDDSNMMLMSAWLLQKGDVVIAFSHSGQTMVVVEAVQQARKNGAKIIAVTNSPMSVLAEQSDVVLCANAVESPLTGENAAARIAQLIIVEGTVDGDLQAEKSVFVKETAKVCGNIYAPTVSITEGANFSGSIDMDGKKAAQQSGKFDPVRPSKAAGGAA